MSDRCAQQTDDLIERGQCLMDKYDARLDQLLRDHVSKSELKAWCEAQIARPATPSDNTYPVEALGYVADNICKAIIREFCKE